MPDFGKPRRDFPASSEETMIESVQRILALPDETRIFVGHAYEAAGRDEFARKSAVGERSAKKVHVGGNRKPDAFVAFCNSRNKSLSVPKPILASLQVNMRAGHMPTADANGDVSFKTPVNKV